MKGNFRTLKNQKDNSFPANFVCLVCVYVYFVRVSVCHSKMYFFVKHVWNTNIISGVERPLLCPLPTNNPNPTLRYFRYPTINSCVYSREFLDDKYPKIILYDSRKIEIK